MFTCRTCHVGEPATSYCVYQNKLNSQVGDTAGVTQDVASDPTVCVPELSFGFLSIPGFCMCCGKEMACETCGRTYYAVPKDLSDECLSPASDALSHESSIDSVQQA